MLKLPPFLDALEGHCTPDRAWAVSFPDGRLETSIGPLTAPQPLRYVVCTTALGVFRCAGQGQSSGTWEYDQATGQWTDHGANSGERPVIYNAAGVLYIVRPGPDVPVEGWASIGPDGQPVRIVRYDAARDIHEYTIAGPLVVGQGSYGGVEIQFDGQRYQPEAGDTHTIWAPFGGGVLALATRKLAQRETVLMWIDFDEIPTLPPAPRQPPVIIVPPIVVDPPKEPAVEVPNLFEIVERVAARVPLNGPADCGPFTEACAIECHKADARFGHLKKSPGQNQFNGHAVDALLFKDTGQAVDIIVGSKTATPKPGWGVDIPRYSAADWIAPAGTVDPPKPDPPTHVDDGELKARLTLVEAALATVGRRLDDEQAAREALSQRVDNLPKPGGAVDLSGYAKKGDPVTVSGKVPFIGNITARGRIDA